MRLALAAAIVVAAFPAAADFHDGVSDFAKGRLAAALAEFREVGAKGHSGAQLMAGYMLERGMAMSGSKGIQANPKEAAEWYAKAAAAGEKRAMEYLAAMYATGHGVEHDPQKALELFRDAGRISMSGTLERDQAEAIAWGTAVDVLAYREARSPRSAGRRNSFGTVELVVEAETANVRIVKTDALEDLQQACLQAVRRALELAPPPQAAVKLSYRQPIGFVFEMAR